MKRFGFRVELTDSCWQASESETNILVKDLRDPNSIVNAYFQHPKIFSYGRYDPKHILFLGFLHTKHRARAAQESALWGIINPKIEETID